jgi:hypothetical protein
MWVCAQRLPATMAMGSIGRSSSTTDHTARTNTTHHTSGRYGFQGSVMVETP